MVSLQMKRYPSITNTSDAKMLGAIRASVPADTQWVVTEKVHGANLQVITNGDTVRCASRSRMLDDEKPDFYNVESIVKSHRSKFALLFEAIKYFYRSKHRIEALHIFGEIFGGYYASHDPPTTPGSKRVQAGVDYMPYNEFYAFDIWVSLNEKEKKGFFMDYDDMIRFLSQVPGLPYAHELQRGTLDEVLAFNPVMETQIPRVYGSQPLQDLKGPYSTAEGVVLRPATEQQHVKFEGRGKSRRVILKHKSPQFSERCKRPKTALGASVDGLEWFMDEAKALLNQNRIDAVISHHGREQFEKWDIKRQAGMIVRDIIKELRSDLETQHPLYAKRSQLHKALSGYIFREVHHLLVSNKSHFGEALDLAGQVVHRHVDHIYKHMDRKLFMSLEQNVQIQMLVYGALPSVCVAISTAYPGIDLSRGSTFMGKILERMFIVAGMYVDEY